MQFPIEDYREELPQLLAIPGAAATVEMLRQRRAVAARPAARRAGVVVA